MEYVWDTKYWQKSHFWVKHNLTKSWTLNRLGQRRGLLLCSLRIEKKQRRKNALEEGRRDYSEMRGKEALKLKNKCHISRLCPGFSPLLRGYPFVFCSASRVDLPQVCHKNSHNVSLQGKVSMPLFSLNIITSKTGSSSVKFWSNS